MKENRKFFASACNHCEAFVPKDEVVWKIVCYKGNKKREIGYLTEKELEKYAKMDRIVKTGSSTICIPHMANTTADGSLEQLENKIEANRLLNGEEITEGILRAIRLYKKYSDKKPKNVSNLAT